MSQPTRDRLRQHFLDKHADLIPVGPRGQVDSVRSTRRAYVRADERAIGYAPYCKGELPDPLPATLVAFYLPQFHPIPENDTWWGKGFTEWRNVTRALPQFEGHVQPLLPGDLGFYDLRDPEIMHKQTCLAREYGIGAFCFYFYWFGGKTLLEIPLRNWLEDRSLDMPFCLCWANEKWTRSWDGRGHEVLIDQSHSAEDDIEFISHVARYLKDSRYLKVDGKPVLLIYRPGLLPEVKATALRWRTWCRANGLGEIHLAYVQSFESPDPQTIGFDAAVEFPPNMSSAASVAARQHLINPEFSGDVLDWRDLPRNSLAKDRSTYSLHPTVNPAWDNEARRPGKGRVFLHSSPRRYRDWLKNVIDRIPHNATEAQKLVFVNAWNEWAEGAVLEPDTRLGHAYLDATRKALLNSGDVPSKGNDTPCTIIHVWFPEVLDEILHSLKACSCNWLLLVTTTPEHENTVRAQLDASGMPFELLVFENRGRDMLPFLHAANRLLDQGIKVVLKLHTKRSTHLSNGDDWRRELIQRLVGQTRAAHTLAAFEHQPDLGLVAPEGHILPLGPYIGSNQDNVERLAARMGIPPPDLENDEFVSGSMFWIRLEALRPVLDLHLKESDFETESGQTDGSFAHAIERLISLGVSSAGFRSITSASLVNEPTGNTSYPYAKRR